jgi:hypothetical protein
VIEKVHVLLVDNLEAICDIVFPSRLGSSKPYTWDGYRSQLIL